ncbi:hypothetical protein KUF71_009990, partial [Frankliniella fusca]
YHWPLVLIFSFVLPVTIPVYGWNVAWTVSWLANIVRIVLLLNITLLGNSLLHAFGYKPYDKRNTATDHWLSSYIVLGEGWHNYHHTFPSDYKSDEHPYFFNFTTSVIDCFAKLGWAYDLKTTRKDVVLSVAMRQGDGSRAVTKYTPKVP